jgi:hypothetical protein
MLELRPNCKCCNKDLPSETIDARICSFECTFCMFYADSMLEENCPKCDGELVSCPRRPASKLGRFPASTERAYNPPGCENTVWQGNKSGWSMHE